MNMMTKKLIAIRVSQATKAKLDDLAQLYGTQTEAVAVALDRLHSQSIGTSERGESRMTTYRVTFKENGSLFVPSDGRAAILDEWTDLDASTEKNVVIEYTIDDECSNKDRGNGALSKQQNRGYGEARWGPDSGDAWMWRSEL